MKKMLTTFEAAELTGYHRKWIAQLCKLGKISGAVKVPGKFAYDEWRIPRNSLLKYSPEIRPNSGPHKSKAKS